MFHNEVTAPLATLRKSRRTNLAAAVGVSVLWIVNCNFDGQPWAFVLTTPKASLSSLHAGAGSDLVVG